MGREIVRFFDMSHIYREAFFEIIVCAITCMCEDTFFFSNSRI